MKKIFLSLLFLTPFSAFADCDAIMTLPLKMLGTQNQLMWSGKIMGDGNGSVVSTCPANNNYTSDFRYNIIAKTASCINTQSQQVISNLPVNVTLSGVDTATLGQMNGNANFYLFGALVYRDGTHLPHADNSSLSGSFYNDGTIDISTLPAGSYNCNVRIGHAAFGTNNSNGLEQGAALIFPKAEQAATNSLFPITINSACSIASSLTINHGAVLTDTINTKKEQISVMCNKANSFKVNLTSSTGTSDQDGVLVNMSGTGGSTSKLSVSEDDITYDKDITIDMSANVTKTIHFKSVLSAKGSGSQSGSAVALINYD